MCKLGASGDGREAAGAVHAVGGRTLAQSLALLAGKISDTTRFARAVALLALAKKSLSADFDQPL